MPSARPDTRRPGWARLPGRGLATAEFAAQAGDAMFDTIVALHARLVADGRTLTELSQTLADEARLCLTEKLVVTVGGQSSDFCPQSKSGQPDEADSTVLNYSFSSSSGARLTLRLRGDDVLSAAFVTAPGVVYECAGAACHGIEPGAPATDLTRPVSFNAAVLGGASLSGTLTLPTPGVAIPVLPCDNNKFALVLPDRSVAAECAEADDPLGLGGVLGGAAGLPRIGFTFANAIQLYAQGGVVTSITYLLPYTDPGTGEPVVFQCKAADCVGAVFGPPTLNSDLGVDLTVRDFTLTAVELRALRSDGTPLATVAPAVLEGSFSTIEYIDPAEAFPPANDCAGTTDHFIAQPDYRPEAIDICPLPGDKHTEQLTGGALDISLIGSVPFGVNPILVVSVADGAASRVELRISGDFSCSPCTGVTIAPPPLDRRPRGLWPLRSQSRGMSPGPRAVTGELSIAMTPVSPDRTFADLLGAARACRLASDLDTAEALARQAVARAESQGDRHGLAHAVTLLARILHDHTRFAEGLACALRAVELCEAVDDRRSAAQAHEVAARVLLEAGDADAALAEGMAALRVAESWPDPAALMAAMCALTNIYAQMRQWDKALEFGERYCEAARQVGDKATESAAIDTVSYIYGGMAQEAAEQGHEALAREYEERTVELSGAALRMAREVGNRLGEATCVGNLAESLSNTGRHEEALALLDSWVADPVRDTASIVAHHRETRGIVLVGLGRHAEAVELLTRSVTEAPSLSQEITARRALALLLETLGDLRGALDHQKRLFTLVSEQSSEAARRAASVAAVRLQTVQAEERAARLQARASDLLSSNEIIHRRSEDLQRQAFEDPLTGLPNRRRLEHLLATDGHNLSIVMLDVDHFKEVNDHHSHLVGDAVLCALAELLRANCRDGDMALRFGGEEFTLMVRHASAEGLLAVAERTRASVQAHAWQAIAPGLAVTASFGIAHSSEAPTSIALLALADARLYAAKQGGRNRVVAQG